MFRKTLILPLFFLIAGLGSGRSEEYFRIARLSYLNGHVSFQHAGDVDWAALSINMPLQPGDRIYTGDDGRAEIEFDDGSVYRLAERTDVEIIAMNEAAIQVRILVGLSTLNVQSDLHFEIDTPPAAFNTGEPGVYRFDVAENGDTDGIVRKGSMEAVNNESRQIIQTGDWSHISLDAPARQQLSRYQGRDEWDEWNDRKNADMIAYASRGIIPSFVFGGVGDLDRYGHWVDVSGYGPGWVPSVGSSWYPYWEGRWCYRPLLGWTWVSYEPWGWLPYHYGRWYWDAAFGWCWLPGPAFGFNFWSPALVGFYQGPGWISWCPLGPGDYYNVNLLHYRPGYLTQLNDVRMLQTRSPGNFVNGNVRGAVRTVQTNFFLNNALGQSSGVLPMNGNLVLGRGKVVNGALDLKPTARSFSPMPDRPAVRPSSAVVSRSWERVTPNSSSGAANGLPAASYGNVPGTGVAGSRNIESGIRSPGQQGSGRPFDGGSRQVVTPPGVSPAQRNIQGPSGIQAPSRPVPRPQQSSPAPRTQPSSPTPRQQPSTPAPPPRYERVVPEQRPQAAPAAPAPTARPKTQKESYNGGAPVDLRENQNSMTVSPGISASAPDSWQGRRYSGPPPSAPAPLYHPAPPAVSRVYTYSQPAYSPGSGLVQGSISGGGMWRTGSSSSTVGAGVARRR